MLMNIYTFGAKERFKVPPNFPDRKCAMRYLAQHFPNTLLKAILKESDIFLHRMVSREMLSMLLLM